MADPGSTFVAPAASTPLRAGCGRLSGRETRASCNKEACPRSSHTRCGKAVRARSPPSIPRLVSADVSLIALGGPVALAGTAHGWSVCGGGTNRVDHESGLGEHGNVTCPAFFRFSGRCSRSRLSTRRDATDPCASPLLDPPRGGRDTNGVRSLNASGVECPRASDQPGPPTGEPGQLPGRAGLRTGSYAAAAHSYRWWRPPTRRWACTAAAPAGRGSTRRVTGASFSTPRCVRSPW